MFYNKNRKIAWKLVFFTILFSSVITLIITAFQLFIDYKNGLHNIDSQLYSIEAGYKDSLGHSLWVDDRDQLILQMNGILNLSDIKYVRVSIGETENISVGTELEKSYVENKIKLNYKYEKRDIYVGTVFVMADLQGLYSELINKVIVILFSQGIKTFLTTFFILFLVQYLLIRHLEVISEFSKHFNINNIMQPLVLQKRDNSDELDEVVSAFNFMQNTIKDELKKLENLNEHLEERVSDRTKELQGTVDELSIAQEQLIQSEKMASLGSLVAGVAHEINTPVGLSITGVTFLSDETKRLSELYEKESMSKNDFESYLEINEKINKSVYLNLNRAAELIRSFKMVAADQSIENKHTFSLSERIEQVLISINNHVKHTKINIKVVCDNNFYIYGDPGVIIQVITNLIMNSFMHAFKEHEVGTIGIHVFEKNEYIYIVYTDSGKGITQEVLPKIFDPFFTTNRESGGTGLGMHIIYNIVVSRLNGTINVSSEVNNGVKFEIKFPKELDPANS